MGWAGFEGQLLWSRGTLCLCVHGDKAVWENRICPGEIKPSVIGSKRSVCGSVCLSTKRLVTRLGKRPSQGWWQGEWNVVKP